MLIMIRFDSKSGDPTQGSSFKSNDKGNVNKLSKLSVGSVYRTLGIKGSYLGDNEEMCMNQEEQIKKY